MQLHPRDCRAAFIEFNHTDGSDDILGPYPPAGPDWQKSIRKDVTQALIGVEMQSPDPQGLAEHWGRIVGIAVSKDQSGEPELKLPNCSFRFVKGDSEIMSGLTFRVGDIAAVRHAAKAKEGHAVSRRHSFSVSGGVTFHLDACGDAACNADEKQRNPHAASARRFFAPDSIALIGASRDQEKIPGRLLSMLRKNEFPGKLYPINPNYGDIDGLKCYPSIADDRPTDRSRHRHHSGARGARRARAMRRRRRQECGDHLVGICRGGRRQRRDAGRHCRRSPSRPACGFPVPMPKAFTARCRRSPRPSARPSTSSRDMLPLVATKRRIGIVAQSGGIGFAINHRAKALGIAISYVVSAGNESDLGAGEFLDYMVQDASTDVILLFIEGIRDVDKFLAAARRAAEIGKPVIVTKVGRSGAGERAAASHTASMAGWSAAYDAVFAKYGFIVSNDLDEAVDHRRGADHQSDAEGRSRRGSHRVGRRRHLGRRHRRDAGLAGAGTVGVDPGRNPRLIPSYGAARNPIDVTAQGVQQRRLAEEHRSAQRFRRGRCDSGGAVAVERNADAVQAGGTEAGDLSAEQADRVLLLHAAVAVRAAQNWRNPASWCCRG